ncbi:MAG: DUF748 domain-containing protein [Desulfobacteraceae bacterium]|nr:MAG: DUF748 domain-containing protein [Desulfobacteraceae bacterium]
MKLKPGLNKILIGLAIFFVIFTLAGFFALPPLLKSVLSKKLSENLHREVSISQINFNPFTLSVKVKGLLVKERNSTETFVSCDEIFLDFQSLSAFKRAAIFREILLKQPFIKVSLNPDMFYNFSDLIEKKETKIPEEENRKPLRFSFRNIKIENGSIDFRDGPKQTQHTVRELNIGVPFFSNIPYYVDTDVQPVFSAIINGTPYKIEGKTKPYADSLETYFDINIKNLDIPYYLAYIPVKMNFQIVSASLDTNAKISFIQYKNREDSLKVTGNISLKKMAIDDIRKNPLFRLPMLEISIAESEPLSQRIHLSKVSIQYPELGIRREKNGDLNLESLFPEKSSKEDSDPLSIEIDEIEMAGGKIFFSDLSGSKPFRTLLNPIDLKVGNFSNARDKKSAFSLLMKTEAKEDIKLDGEFSIDPVWTEGVLDLSSVQLKKYAPYYQDKILFTIEDGRLNFSTRYKYAKGDKDPEINLSGMSVIIRSLRLKQTDEKNDFLIIPDFSVKETDLDLIKREVKIGGIFTQKGDLHIRHSKNGDVNLFQLVAKQPVSDDKFPDEQPSGEKSKPAEKPWMVSLKNISVDDYTISVEDRMPSEPVNLAVQNLNIRGDNISTARNSKGRLKLSFLLNRKGFFSAAGSIGVDPPAADLLTELKGIEITPLQSYFTDKVKITVTGGAISTSGNLSFSSDGEKGIKAGYKGDASLSNFSSIDKLNAEDFLKWESLSFSDINAGYNPLLIDIKGISLTNFYSRVILNADKSLNLQEIMEKGESKKEISPPPAAEQKTAPPAIEKRTPSQKEKGPAKDIKIGSITLQGGIIDFSDRSLKPEYSAKLTEIGGRVSGLSSEETTMADIEIRGKLDDYAPLEITGRINPLKEELYADVKARFKDMDLSSTTPYAGKYVGYTVEKGKLSFDLKYLIADRKIESQNYIFLDQFALGDKVESPQATNLPVKLAIALLKDRKGEIKLDIPVTGSLDDPQFSIWKIILKILVNLISKAATSPFALLGAAFGGGEELGFVEFDYGRTVITEQNMKKLETIEKALSDKPALKMDIEGHVDMEKDREGLKQYLFNRKFKAQKLKDMIKKGEPAIPVDDVQIEKQEYEKYLKMAYREEKFPKPKNFIGMTKDLPPQEMEKLILTHIEVKEGDLRSLAVQRAMQIKEFILKSGKVQPERIFIIEPKSLAPEKKEKLRESRVDLMLK